MGNRLSKIYTRTGDDGTTGMADGSRVSKADLRFDAMGKIDLLNSQIGLLRGYLTQDNHTQNSQNQPNHAQFDAKLSRLQHQLFNLGGELAMPEYRGILAEYVTELENQIDGWNTHLPPLKDFILPAGTIVTSQVHIARCYCRDAERLLVALNSRDDNVSPLSLQFINRLSDWLFVLARVVARLDAGQEVLWDKNTLS
ncbi:cob(I)yrinic acid a,c-diamide adenosyltransferase [Moraxella osloensis]|uniref:Corrinoid adenosyltransferase n=1 Tax=Faucicola osloensis TaxID=34062 RepID=A0AAW6T9W4_FAUOS|nr:cob(I)yrinic acid a,c-diamide adenosyltransferase [Moraxella osloensis]MDI4508806.1 cob(I)yrinic acid a,c-diamide adenosyltransferase [Moraxella osloensis]ONG37552.1 ATP:cob(I)alamin adenosyltransferase [Enhydrobacter sp. H5]QCR86564.1 cob(I)yrinic acid a,c-diamide adenosyltransferase [Moraxella osloensis]